MFTLHANSSVPRCNVLQIVILLFKCLSLPRHRNCGTVALLFFAAIDPSDYVRTFKAKINSNSFLTTTKEDVLSDKEQSALKYD